MNLQRVHLKVFTDAPETFSLDPFLDIFARWREDKTHPCAWLDLADYAHVENGPGIMLIGQRGNLSMDLAAPGPGILYANKKDLGAGDADRIAETFRRALQLFEALTGESAYPAELPLRPGFWALTFNDRLDCPNDETTDARLGPIVEDVVDRLFGKGEHSLIREPDPERRYGFTIHAPNVGHIGEIAARL